jgi:predicted TIM-barrel enzyme
VFVGILAVDTLRSTRELIRSIKAAGVGGVINFPSVSFIDGNAGQMFDSLSIGIDREIECLEACVKEGLHIGGVVGPVPAAQRLLRIGVDFLLLHSGPPVRRGRDPIAAPASTVVEFARRKQTPVFLMSDLADMR